MTSQQERWLTVAEVAEHLRLSRAKVYEMAQDGQIPCAKLAGRWRFSLSEIDAWMKQLRSQPVRVGPRETGSIVAGTSRAPLTTRELQWLVGPQQPPCVSIYLPTHRHHPGTEQDRIRFKNLLAQTAELLRRDYPDRDVSRFLAPVEELSTTAFWQHQEDGLALFCSVDMCVHYRLPVSVPELVVVADSFHTKPLVGYLSSNRHYFVLALSHNAVTLYEGTPHALVPVEIEALPRELRAAAGTTRAARLLSERGSDEAEPAPAARGRSLSGKGRKKELTQFFRAVDRALWPILREERAPLVLAAVGYYHPLFLATSRYPYVLSAGVEGNVERMSADELRQAAWALVAAHEAGVEGELQGQLEQALLSGRASTELTEIARAAAQGRVRVLLHEAGRSLWGRIDRNTGDTVVHAEQQDSEDSDIIDDLCEMTLLKGGEVFELSAPDALGGAPLGAIYRY